MKLHIQIVLYFSYNSYWSITKVGINPVVMMTQMWWRETPASYDLGVGWTH